MLWRESTLPSHTNPQHTFRMAHEFEVQILLYSNSETAWCELCTLDPVIHVILSLFVCLLESFSRDSLNPFFFLVQIRSLPPKLIGSLSTTTYNINPQLSECGFTFLNSWNVTVRAPAITFHRYSSAARYQTTF